MQKNSPNFLVRIVAESQKIDPFLKRMVLLTSSEDGRSRILMSETNTGNKGGFAMNLVGLARNNLPCDALLLPNS